MVRELKRNKLCLQKAAVFQSKADTHEGWAATALDQLQTDDYSTANLSALTQMLKKHDAFKSELEAHKPNVDVLGTLATELEELKYNDIANVNTRCSTINAGWDAIMQAVSVQHRPMDQRRGEGFAATP